VSALSSRNSEENIVELPIEVLERGFYQPREYFDPEAMAATLQSIREKGQKYPVVVRPIREGNPLYDPAWKEMHYELADGERRYRCCKELGFKTIKAIVRELSDEEMLDYTLTTNDSLPLNPIEKAMVFSRLSKEFGKSQAEIARSFNLKQQQVSEYIRLLELPKEIQDLTARAVISVRHARELLKISDLEKMKALASEVAEKSLSTRELVKKMKNDKKSSEIVSEKVYTSDILFEKPKEFSEKVEKVEKNVEKSKEDEKKEVIEEISQVLKQQVHHEKGRNWLEKLHFRLIPVRYYEKIQYWLSFELGSTLHPEQCLIRLELALLLGLLAMLAVQFVPLWVVGAFFGFSVALLAFLYLI
jgi:ParB family chromosome partitioning protein